MYYQDNYEVSFQKEDEFLHFLDKVEEHADWKTYPSNTIRVIAAEQDYDACEAILSRESDKGILTDTYSNTGLILDIGGEIYPVGSTTIKTLEGRARISGSSLQDLKKEKLARILNDCLQVTKGTALVRIHEGKVRAVHGGDESDYAVLPMPEIFETAAIHVKEDYDESVFTGGFFEHSMTSASWEIKDKELLDTYRDLLMHYDQIADEELAAAIRVNSSDVGTSGANIFYSLLIGPEKRPLVLGKALKLEHRNQANVELFSGNMSQVFARYKEAISGLSKLFHTYVNYPANVMAGVMKRAGIGKALTARTVEQFKVTHGLETCNGYEVYCGICEAIFLAESNGANPKALADLEENISRCLTYRFHEYDIPGLVNY